MSELEKVKPSEFSLKIGGRKRAVKFGNLALAKIEEKYGSLDGFAQVQEELEKKPMATIPWLLSICLKDKEGLEDSEAILSAMDDDGLTIGEVASVVMGAINSSMAIAHGEEKKTGRKK